MNQYIAKVHRALNMQSMKNNFSRFVEKATIVTISYVCEWYRDIMFFVVVWYGNIITVVSTLSKRVIIDKKIFEGRKQVFATVLARKKKILMYL